MKQFFLFLGVTFSVLSGFAQEFKWDVNAGYLLATSTFKMDFAEANPFSDFDPVIRNTYVEDTNSESGFYLGIGGQYRWSENFALSGGLNYARNNESNFLQVPVFIQYYVGPSDFFIQVGPQFTYILEDLGYSEGDVNKLNVGAGGGIGYDISDNFFLEARYTFQLNKFYKPKAAPEIRTNYLNIGLGYRF